MAGSPDREKALGLALAQIDKQFGKGSVMRLGERPTAQMAVIPTGSIALDIALGVGGLPRGRVVEIYGPESSGKTTVALHAIASAQRLGGIAAFIDAEHALDPDYAKALGVDTDALLVSQPDTGEQALEITDMLVRSGALDIVVIDSVAALVPRAEIEGEMGDSHVGLQARLMSQALRKITGALNNSNTTAVFINQLREKIGVMFGSPETTTGGRALKFYSSIRLDVRRIETLKDSTEAVGNRTRVKVVKNKCLAQGTMVFDPASGVTRRIEEIVNGRLPVSVVAAEKDGTLHARQVVSWFDQGEQDVLGVRLVGGGTLWATPDHKILTDQGWRLIGDLHHGDRVARPREFLGFGDSEPCPPDHARMLGYYIGGGHLEGAGIDGVPPAERTVPVEMFGAEVSRQVVGNLLVGLLETNGFVRVGRTGAIRAGFVTTSEQLAHQIHWLLLRFGVASSVRASCRTGSRPDLPTARTGRSGQLGYETRITGADNIAALAEAIPCWGPRGQALRRALAKAGDRHRGSSAADLPGGLWAPVLAHLRYRGVTPALAARIIGPTAGDPRGGMRQVLGVPKIRRDRLRALAEGLADVFLLDSLGDQIRYATVCQVLPTKRTRTYDVEVDELHTLVADGVVVHNCSAPFKQAEFDIMYGKGISREGSLIDVGVEQGIIRKSGAWYTYDGDQLGQGKENSRSFLKENPDIAAEIEKRILEKLGVGQGVDAAGGPNLPPVDF